MPGGAGGRSAGRDPRRPLPDPRRAGDGRTRPATRPARPATAGSTSRTPSSPSPGTRRSRPTTTWNSASDPQSLDPLPPPNGFWYVYFTYRGVDYYVAMTTGNAPPTPAFEYGRIDLNPATGINEQTTLGRSPTAASAGDTITIRLSRSLLTQPVTIGGPAQPAPVAGDVFDRRQGRDAPADRRRRHGPDHGDRRLDRPASTRWSHNEACAPNEAPHGAASRPRRSPGLRRRSQVDFSGAASSDPDPGDTIAEYTFDFGDGTRRFRRARRRSAHTYTRSATTTPR